MANQKEKQTFNHNKRTSETSHKKKQTPNHHIKKQVYPTTSKKNIQPQRKKQTLNKKQTLYKQEKKNAQHQASATRKTIIPLLTDDVKGPFGSVIILTSFKVSFKFYDLIKGELDKYCVFTCVRQICHCYPGRKYLHKYMLKPC